MKIIKATINHMDNVYDLLCQLENNILDKNDFSQIYKININNKNIHYILAVDGSNLIGFASLHIQCLLHHCANIAEIQEIVISTEQQGLGLGTVLFDELVRIARANDCLQIEVCCNLTREKSHKFYLKQGMAKSHYKFTCDLA